MVARNYWDLALNSYYLLFFNFPLRNNGMVSSGCTDRGSTTYGDAYYHSNIWAIVCKANTNILYSYNTAQGYPGYRNLRITGFYSPWYFVSTNEQTV